MRQHMLNGWLVAALIALTCLLGITAYAEVKKDLPRVACTCGQMPLGDRAAGLGPCTTVCCGNASRSA
ncbi:MAG: hypothetical protein E5V92_30480 [Mesorhizobium sp.]|uniref:hypothetical protein n=1 Tax=unclassified Mesorhizobium TaxID=325217 RepID=UPI000F7615AB|nr:MULTISPECIES: hypothetical protein [unclassified Mesorhizobium]AZO74256.1 hypothetical protein EJ067_26240 [Mesorhizobium sp. M1D.F.Ca.ET.043.01.1.1]RWA96872.1 MAG: hypothetical protein EOQ32_04590 [Mesorhizobium sp.]RWE04999.1 MAG: hypothetical protein EOS61_24120 [Mesorhizobium sp.]TJW75510.1 MAG: hypothetical protein E5V92_30480 [Mesorhizobium sp.]